MTPEETSHLLCAASKAAEAAAHLLLVPDNKGTAVGGLISRSRELLAFAAECGSFNPLSDKEPPSPSPAVDKAEPPDFNKLHCYWCGKTGVLRGVKNPPVDLTALTDIFAKAAHLSAEEGVRAMLKELGIQAAN